MSDCHETIWTRKRHASTNMLLSRAAVAVTRLRDTGRFKQPIKGYVNTPANNKLMILLHSAPRARKGKGHATVWCRGYERHGTFYLAYGKMLRDVKPNWEGIDDELMLSRRYYTDATAFTPHRLRWMISLTAFARRTQQGSHSKLTSCTLSARHEMAIKTISLPRRRRRFSLGGDAAPSIRVIFDWWLLRRYRQPCPARSRMASRQIGFTITIYCQPSAYYIDARL